MGFSLCKTLEINWEAKKRGGMWRLFECGCACILECSSLCPWSLISLHKDLCGEAGVCLAFDGLGKCEHNGLSRRIGRLKSSLNWKAIS